MSSYLLIPYLSEEIGAMRRKPGKLLPLEINILSGGLELQARSEQFHGFALAKKIGEQQQSRTLTAYGTLYRALDRLAKAGLVEAEWEDPQIAASEQRPRRRLYRITLDGTRALQQALKEADQAAVSRIVREGT
ncbi:MAG TPA: helix-turn-helix transcriptional regulator [Thermomicrobiales bacterium]|jgi:DNA-binding PadR family transcriptional regulator